jgi:hypothetical protein
MRSRRAPTHRWPVTHPLAPQVYKGLWKGTTVAVKTMLLPSAMSGAEKREKMAVMETAISSSLSHPNVRRGGVWGRHVGLGDAVRRGGPRMAVMATAISSSLCHPNVRRGLTRLWGGASA